MLDLEPPAVDSLLEEIAAYVTTPDRVDTERALCGAHLVLLDTLACALLALEDPDAVRTAEPLFASASEHQPRVIGTGWATDPVQAAFATGVLVRWQDFNDTWLALEWGHPSDNLGAILPLADHLSRRARAEGRPPMTVADMLRATVQAYEIQGILAEGAALNRHGLDHVALVRVATTAVATRLLGGAHDHVVAALTHAWADGAALRAYRHAPNVTARKSWAAGDAAARGMRLAYLARRGEEPCRQVLTTPVWGFQDALLDGHPLDLPRPMGSYVIENVLLKPWFPAEYHGQTAVETALALRDAVAHRLDSIVRIEIRTHESAMRIIDKRGSLTNPADRDHCLQYMVAVAVLHGELTARHYEDDFAADPRIDRLRELTDVTEEPAYSRAYLDPGERAVANALRVHFDDGTSTPWTEVRLPIGHPARRTEAVPLVRRKLVAGLTAMFGAAGRAESVAADLEDPRWVLDAPVCDLVGLVTPPDAS